MVTPKPVATVHHGTHKSSRPKRKHPHLELYGCRRYLCPDGDRTKAAGDKLANQMNKVEAAEGSCDQQVIETIIVEQDQITSGEFLKKMKMWAGKLSEEAANQVLPKPKPQVQRIMEFPDICKGENRSLLIPLT